jgi:hypothetical protein
MNNNETKQCNTCKNPLDLKYGILQFNGECIITGVSVSTYVFVNVSYE